MITKITDFTLDFSLCLHSVTVICFVSLFFSNTKPTSYMKLDTFLGETTVKMGPLEANSFHLE